MQISITGKQMDVGDALRSHTEGTLPTTVEKYFGNAMEGHVVFSRDGPLFRADISVHVGRGIVVQGQAAHADPHAAFDSASERIGKQLRRHKRRLRNHHNRVKDGNLETVPAQQYVVAPDDWSEDDDGASGAADPPVVIAEMTTEIATLTPGEAVMRLDLADIPAMMFRNSSHGGLNVVYRRPDGNVGWIDPRNIEAAAAADES